MDPRARMRNAIFSRPRPGHRAVRWLTVLIAALSLGACTSPEGAWELAEREDSEAAYLEFLARYPRGELADRARARITELKELRAWERAEFRDQAYKYRQFLEDYPASRFADAARNRIRELERDEAWQNARSDGSERALKAFLEQYPDAPQAAEASEQLRALAATATAAKPRERAGDYRVQLGAFRTPGAADTEVRRLTALFPALLPGPIRIEQSGRFFVLRSAPLTREEAETACRTLSRARQNCLILSRPQ